MKLYTVGASRLTKWAAELGDGIYIYHLQQRPSLKDSFGMEAKRKYKSKAKHIYQMLSIEAALLKHSGVEGCAGRRPS